jgi:hypothetical protein
MPLSGLIVELIPLLAGLLPLLLHVEFFFGFFDQVKLRLGGRHGGCRGAVLCFHDRGFVGTDFSGYGFGFGFVES